MFYNPFRMPDNKLALTAGSLEVVKPQGNKRQPDKWSLYPERTILDIVMATEVNFTFLLINCFVL